MTNDTRVLPEGMVPWSGGDRAPDDWEPNGWLLCRDGHTFVPAKTSAPMWSHNGSQFDLVAYTPRPEQPERPGYAAGIIHEPGTNPDEQPAPVAGVELSPANEMLAREAARAVCARNGGPGANGNIQAAARAGARETLKCIASLSSASHSAAGEGACPASPDHEDIAETIADAADDWKAKGYTSALAEVRDMAAVGRSLMEALPEGYCYMDSPAEIVTDLINERDEAAALSGQSADGAEARTPHGVAWSDDRLGQAYQLIDEAYQDYPSESGPGEAIRAAREAVEAADMEIPE